MRRPTFLSRGKAVHKLHARSIQPVRHEPIYAEIMRAPSTRPTAARTALRDTPATDKAPLVGLAAAAAPAPVPEGAVEPEAVLEARELADVELGAVMGTAMCSWSARNQVRKETLIQYHQLDSPP